MLSKITTKSVMAAVIAGAAAPAILLGAAAPASADVVNGNPTLFFAPFPGGLRVTVQSFTPEDTNCTYNANSIRRDFFLKGFGIENQQANFPNAKAELVFPGVPLFKKWNVNVVCQNGKSTSVEHWY